MEGDLESFLSDPARSLSHDAIRRLNTRPPRQYWAALKDSVVDSSKLWLPLALFTSVALFHLLGLGLIVLGTLGVTKTAHALNDSPSGPLLKAGSYESWGYVLWGASLLSVGAWLVTYIQRRRQQIVAQQLPVIRGA